MARRYARGRYNENRERSRSHSPSVLSDADVTDDTSGLVQFEKGDVLYDRYKIHSLAGQGTFGTVLNAYDQRRTENVAIKVVRCVKRYLDAAYVEIDILDNLRKADKTGNSLCVRMRKSFVCHHRHKRHVCLVFEPLGRSLYDFLKRNDFQGFSLEHVRDFSYQILFGIAFCHERSLIHTDLKLENVLLVNDTYDRIEQDGRAYRIPTETDVRIIDFGGATYSEQHHARMINTRQYRAPEVILGLGWSYPSDLWSIGCMISELYTGELLFGTHEDAEHLALMERILGTRFSTKMTFSAIKKCREEAKAHGGSNGRKRRRGRSSSLPRADRMFNETSGRLQWPRIASSEESRRHVASVKALRTVFGGHPDLLDLLGRLLTLDPDERITARDALGHRFFDRIRNESQQATQHRRYHQYSQSSQNALIQQQHMEDAHAAAAAAQQQHHQQQQQSHSHRHHNAHVVHGGHAGARHHGSGGSGHYGHHHR